MGSREITWDKVNSIRKVNDRIYPILRVVALYVCFAILWIVFSDNTAQWLFPGFEAYKNAQTYKGILFVLASGTVIFILLKRELEHREAVWRAYLDEKNALLDQLERKAVELTLAYDATIEGWARALELRDREVQNHSNRVTDVTLNLARALNVGEEDLEHIRRGALLHDIGKMGIPDSLLLKPGPFEPDERIDMQKHAEYAITLLDKIDFLRPALEIPACHHERWDGRGYPNGLAGDQIPLPARIFAVVDVWDALTSDRPYRSAWTAKEALDYIDSQSGKQFDPFVVNEFLRLVGQNIRGITP